MNRYKFTFIIILLISAFLASGCNDSTTDPPAIDNSPTTWASDQIGSDTYPYMKNIWGSSSKDIYTVGVANEFASKTEGWIWHYDGEDWNELDMPVAASDVADLYGTSAENIWFIGELANGYSLILNYDGNGGWTNYSSEEYRSLTSICGLSSSNIWVCGAYKRILHFNGSEWERIPFIETNKMYNFASIGGVSDNDLYMTGTLDVDAPKQSFLFHYDGNNWTTLNSSDINFTSINFETKFKTIDNTLYLVNPDVYVNTGQQWTQVIEGYSINGFGGSSADNLYAVGDYGYANHFNGTGWQMITTGSYTSEMNELWTDGSEVFILGNGYNKSFIVHGK